MKRQLKLVTLILCASLLISSGAAHAKCFGLYTGDSPSPEQLAKVKNLYGEAPCSILLFYDATWVPSVEQLQVIDDAGAVPVLTIEPWNASTKEGIELKDDYAKELATALNAFNKTVFIRFAHEMNGNWYPWSGSPEKYIKLYRDFHSRVKAHTTNPLVKWIFSVNGKDIPESPENAIQKYYPGDDVVDVIGIDAYLDNPPAWKRLHLRVTGVAGHMFGNQVTTALKFGKPIIITETAIAAGDDFKSWAIKSMFSELEKEFPFIEQVVWFDIKKEADWRIASGIKSLEFFRKAIRAWK